ncbi:hypothetical protein MM236_15090 [Belliella sp. DSM 107340]|uniref:Uncharacterized protein n=1 Tax=Belliella calami TaxID=2923436 RepID=A0ABS9UT21_9BACT|nr:hypothetical protein [Belliella calami]MCH7399325.1 hypothetical protein [Belliella calami]
MRKASLLFAILIGTSTLAFPCSGTYYACGGQDIQNMVMDMDENCSSGSHITIIDVCDNDHIYEVDKG